MPSWNELNPGGGVFNPMEPRKEKPAEPAAAPLTRDQVQSAIHKIIVPHGTVPYVSIVGNEVIVEFKPQQPPPVTYKIYERRKVSFDEKLIAMCLRTLPVAPEPSVPTDCDIGELGDHPVAYAEPFAPWSSTDSPSD